MLLSVRLHDVVKFQTLVHIWRRKFAREVESVECWQVMQKCGKNSLQELEPSSRLAATQNVAKAGNSPQQL
jgi:hypothetical protein